jgi:ubiquinone/menaquinone biosynthesis C-methylase UbiE
VKETDVVLDFGCGPGFYTIPLAKTAKEVVAVDIQSKMLEKTSKYAEKNGVKIKTLQSDGKTISLPDDSFDLILLSGVYHEISDKVKLLTELTRLLKPYGRIVIRERTEPGLIMLGPPRIDKEEVFKELKAAGFDTLAAKVDPSDKRTTLMIATAK